ncbi:MAG: accessory factor UbiK family protein [Deltaproteobacteria bacterium]|nr:accessory factor UbiK family protein [Deltaproteobacteria bacterium]
MAGLIDKALLAGLGIEKRAKKRFNTLAREGNKEIEEGLDMKEDFENKLVENIVNVVGAGLKKVGVAKKEIDHVAASIAEDLAERLKIVTLDDLDVVEKLVMKNREKVGKLEKQIKKLEDKLSKLSEEKSKG